MSYTKNEVALETLISNINNQFYYIGEEDDKVAPIDVKKFSEHCVAFIDSLRLKMNPISVTHDERYEFIKLYDILRDMDFELTPIQEAVFEKFWRINVRQTIHNSKTSLSEESKLIYPQ